MFSLSTKQISQSIQKISNEKYQLMTIEDITDSNHPYQLVLVYASAGCPFRELVEDLKKLLCKNKTIIVTGDFNFDKKDTNVLTHFLGTRKLTQLVNWPTQKEGRVIDHVYAPLKAVEVTRHIPYYSDHDGLCIRLCK